MTCASTPLPWKTSTIIMQLRQRKPPSLLVQLIDLLLIELTNWRWSWRSLVIAGTLAPLLSILALGVFARDSGPQTLGYVLSGNVVLALMFGNMRSVESHFVFMRTTGTLDYFASLPVQRTMLILAVILAFLLLSIPSIVVTIVLGSLALGVPILFNPLLILVVPLCAIPLAGIGALIGVVARNPQEAGAYGLVITLGLIGMGPVVVPPDRLADWLLVLGHFSPATYAASAMRQTLIGPMTSQIIIDGGVLVLLGTVIFWLVSRKLDWRQR